MSKDGIFGDRKVDLIYSAYMMNTLFQQQKLGKHCDLRVLVGEREYKVHRSVFASSSEELDSQVTELDKIQLCGVTCYGFEGLVEILYCGKLRGISSVSEKMLRQIVTAADALSAETVVKYCCREREDLMKLIMSRNYNENADTNNNNATQVIDVLDYNRKFPELPNHCVSLDKPLHPLHLHHHPHHHLHQEHHHHHHQSPATYDRNSVGNFNHNQGVERWGNNDPYHVANEVVVQTSLIAGNQEIAELPTPPPAVAAAAETLYSTSVANANSSSDMNHLSTDHYRCSSVEVKKEPDTNNRPPPTIMCRLCGQFFHTPGELNDHHLTSHVNDYSAILYHTNPGQQQTTTLVKPPNTAAGVYPSPPHQCPHCNQEHTSYELLDAHIKMVHGGHQLAAHKKAANNKKINNYPNSKAVDKSNKRKIDISVAPLISPTALNTLARGADGKYSCPFCQRGFDRRWNLKCHILIHTSKKNEGNSTPTTTTTTEGGNTQRSYTGYSFTCPNPKCSKLFRNMNNLRRHVNSKHQMNPAELNIALKNQPNPPSNSTEVVTTNNSSSSSPPTNNVASSFDTNTNQLTANNNNKRSADDSNSADTPPAKVAKVGGKQKFPKKKRSDTDFQFKCEVCGKGFKRNRNLRGHMDVHANNGKAAEYKCPVCGRGFSQKESLNGHLWVHGGSKNEDGTPLTTTTMTTAANNNMQLAVYGAINNSTATPSPPITTPHPHHINNNVVVPTVALSSHMTVAPLVSTPPTDLPTMTHTTANNNQVLVGSTTVGAPAALQLVQVGQQQQHPSPYDMPNHW